MAVQSVPSKKTPAAPAPAPETAPSASAAAAASKRGRMKKEDAPFSIMFVNDKGEDSTRMPSVIAGIKIVSFDKKAKTYPIDNIPPATMRQLAADSLKREFRATLADVTKTNISTLFTNSDEFYASAKNGNVFVYKEGGGPGRSFDFDYWLDVVKRVSEIQVEEKMPKARLMTDKDRDTLRAKWAALTPTEREKNKVEWRKNSIFRRAELQVKLAREENKEEDADTLFEIL